MTIWILEHLVPSPYPSPSQSVLLCCKADQHLWTMLSVNHRVATQEGWKQFAHGLHRPNQKAGSLVMITCLDFPGAFWAGEGPGRVGALEPEYLFNH